MRIIIFILSIVLTVAVAKAETFNICSSRGIKSLDPSMIEDEISSAIMTILDLTLFRKDGTPSHLVKSFQHDKETNTLLINLNPKTFWSPNDKLIIPRPVNSEDVYKTLTRFNPENVKVIFDQYKSLPFRRYVGSAIKKVEIKSQIQIQIQFEENADFKQILSSPQSAILFADFVKSGKILTTKNFSLMGDIESNDFSIKTPKDQFYFKLKQPPEKLHDLIALKKCQVGLQIGKNEAQYMQRVLKASIRQESNKHSIVLFFNPFYPLTNSMSFIKIMTEIFSTLEETGDLRALTPTREKIYPSSDFLFKKSVDSEMAKIRGYFTVSLPEQGFYKNIGLDSFYDSLRKKIKQFNLPARIEYTEDQKMNDDLIRGHFQILVNDIIDLETYGNCYLPEDIHPLKTCSSDLKKILNEKRVVPLFHYHYYRVSLDPKLLSVF